MAAAQQAGSGFIVQEGLEIASPLVHILRYALGNAFMVLPQQRGRE